MTTDTPIVCPNPACKEVLGACNAIRLTPAGSTVAVSSSVTLVCPKCHRRRKWHPSLDAEKNRR